MIRILLADDFAIVRVLLRQLLEKTDDMQVVAMAANGQEAVNEAVTHCPDVAVMDMSMPTMDGVEATKQICSECPQTRVLIVSAYNTPYYIHRSIEVGARGYVLKDVVRQELVTAVRTLHQGSLYFSKQIADLAKFYIRGEIGKETDTELVKALERLQSGLLFLFITYVVFLECFH
jgi:DNA-binding NarL/FixJ family response regulator